MLGDKQAIKYANRDLDTLRRAVALTPGRAVAVQAGGSLGVFALELALEFAAVYCFEPDPVIFRSLAHNVPDENVILLQAALGVDRVGVSTSRERRRKVHLPPHDGITHVAGPGVIPTLRVDDLGLQSLDLLVLDTEGHELYALMGAVESITKHRPTVMVEVNENCEFYGIRQDDVRTWLRIEGYEMQFRIHSDEVYTWRK